MDLMSGLSGWLRQIIAVVLLASIVDLLLPNRTMQRYVRLVAGLFILLTVATPVLNWLKGDFGDKLAEGISTVERSPEGAPEQLAMIEANGEKLRDKQSDQAANLVSTQLAAAIRTDIEESEHRQVRTVDVQTAKDKSGNWDVTGVTVEFELAEADDSSPDQTDQPIASMQGIEPIAAVDIQIDVGSDQTRQGEGAEASAPPEEDALPAVSVEAVDSKLQARVASLVANRFGIEASRIKVTQASAR
jgi:stage III sporulation protein AF